MFSGPPVHFSFKIGQHECAGVGGGCLHCLASVVENSKKRIQMKFGPTFVRAVEPSIPYTMQPIGCVSYSTQAAHLLRANIIVLFLLFAEDKFHET